MITRLEETILIAIWKLKENAYGVPIHKEVSKTMDKTYSMGSLYFSLDQLLRKGYVVKTVKQFYRASGGRSRTYYGLTDEGEKALKEVREYQNSLWAGISKMAFGTRKQK